jgi:hypothetical protein
MTMLLLRVEPAVAEAAPVTLPAAEG